MGDGGGREARKEREGKRKERKVGWSVTSSNEYNKTQVGYHDDNVKKFLS